MSDRLYLMPITGAGTEDDQRRPKHAALLGEWGMMDFGFEPLCIVWANLADDSVLTANADVLALPLDLDQNLTAGAVTVVHDALEARNLPGDWVTTAHTYRQVARVVCGVFMFFQRLNVFLGNVRVFGGGVTLDTTFGGLGAGAKSALVSAALDLNLDTAGVTAATPLRAILKGLADQLSQAKVQIGAIAV